MVFLSARLLSIHVASVATGYDWFAMEREGNSKAPSQLGA